MTASGRASTAGSSSMPKPGPGGSGTAPSGPDTVRNSAFTDYAYPVNIYDSIGVVHDNQVVRPSSYGIQVNAFAAPTDSAIILNNVVTCPTSGASFVRGVYGANSNFRISGNTIQGCFMGIQLQGGVYGNTAAIRGNTLLGPGNDGGEARG